MRFWFILFCTFGLFSCGKEDYFRNKKNNLQMTVTNFDQDCQTLEDSVYKLSLRLRDILSAGKYDASHLQDYCQTKEGALYKQSDDGKSSLYVTGYHPLNDEIKKTVLVTENFDSLFAEIMRQNGAIVQVYYNDANCLSRVFPPLKVFEIYTPKTNICRYNFYYLADKENNPQRKPVWVKTPSPDHAERGWLVSLLAPIYQDTLLAGVCGIDLQVNNLYPESIASGSNNFFVMNSGGNIIWINDFLTKIFYLPPLREQDYAKTITSSHYRMLDYNLLKGKSKAVRLLAQRIIDAKAESYKYEFGNESYRLLSVKSEKLNWYFTLVEKDRSGF